jgi:hypothetical protein
LGSLGILGIENRKLKIEIFLFLFFRVRSDAWSRLRGRSLFYPR